MIFHIYILYNIWTINNISTIYNIWLYFQYLNYLQHLDYLNIWIITIFGQCITCFFFIYSAKKDKDHIFSEVLKRFSLYLKVVLLLIWDPIHQYSILSSTPLLCLHCVRDTESALH
jgi:hypothetical protein